MDNLTEREQKILNQALSTSRSEKRIAYTHYRLIAVVVGCFAFGYLLWISEPYISMTAGLFCLVIITQFEVILLSRFKRSALSLISKLKRNSEQTAG